MRQPIAVLTGDVIASRRIADTPALYRVLDATLGRLAEHYGGRFERYRGDGFQLALPAAGAALDAAVALRAALIMHSDERRWDARVAMAVGSDDWQADRALASADGPVFVASGRALDALAEGAAHLALTRPGAPRDAALALLVRYVDELVDGWSRYSAEIACLSLWHDESQQAMAERLGIRQPSVHKRLRTARWALLADTLDFFRHRLATEGPAP
ncbi:hypothetical protein [Halomonas sp. M4R1S46]|uniref:hypothetical protein n=1 Tax=Halomonas sp. M4R1S46 TaxID=2982692 RepID=UPI0021E47FBB|nr:hypothetical protein [Halomonas sp. M4R1S46]UYG08983.1 hypothetical protein OCT48_06535 [Halomonas sp. M4R1S46]